MANSRHLVRAGALLVGGLALFVAARGVLTPDDFGALGHYRMGALADVASQPLRFAGRQACAECHAEVVAARAGGRHERVGCESCHGALAVHAADPGAMTPERPDPAGLCLRCHRANVSMPAGAPQVDPAEHGAGSSCTECHLPHHPDAS